MSFSLPDNRGIVDLANLQARLHFVNRALHILQLHSDSHGFLGISSSDKLLRGGLPQLNEQQVRDVNQIIFDLGLRSTKPGGGEHIIRMDVTHVTMEQLKAGRRIPVEKEEILTQELFTHVSLALEALRESAEPIKHPRFTLGVVRNHMQIIEDLCGEQAGEVIMYLRALTLYRMQAFPDGFVCFVNMTQPAVLTEREVSDKKPLITWPDTLGELLPPSAQVSAMPVQDIIESLVRACELAEQEKFELTRDLSHLTEQIGQLAAAFEQMERRCNEAEQQNSSLTKDNERLTGEVKQLKGELDELRNKPAGATMDPKLRSRVDDILGRYGQGGATGTTDK